MRQPAGQLAGGVGRQGLSAADHAAQGRTPLDALFGEEDRQHGGHEMGDGDAGGGYEVAQIAAVLLAAGLGENDARTGGQGPEELPDRHVEADGGLLQDGVVGPEAVGVLHPLDAVGDRPVGVRDALRAARGAGGVDEVRGVVGARSRRSPARPGRLRGVVQQHDLRGAAVRCGQSALGEQDGRVAVGEEEGEAFGGVAGFQRGVARTGAQDAEQTGDEFG